MSELEKRYFAYNFFLYLTVQEKLTLSYSVR